MFTQRTIRLIGDLQRETVINLAKNVPLDIEVVFREPVKARSISQNNMYWANLEEISQQLWHQGKQYSANGWHQTFKILYAPDETVEPYIHELVKNPDSYKKYETIPNGDRICVASTTDFTKKGLTDYLEQIYAFSSSHGVKFTTVQR